MGSVRSCLKTKMKEKICRFLYHGYRQIYSNYNPKSNLTFDRNNLATEKLRCDTTKNKPMQTMAGGLLFGEVKREYGLSLGQTFLIQCLLVSPGISVKLEFSSVVRCWPGNHKALSSLCHHHRNGRELTSQEFHTHQ
jgi:hypothetical protein